jgi:hypothetical protein
VTEITFTGNQVKLCSGYGFSLSNLGHLTLTGNLVMDNGVGNANTSGIKVSTTAHATIGGNRGGNSVATDQDYGLEFGATVTDAIIMGNDFKGNQIAGSLGLTQDALILGNLGISNNNAPPASIAAKANIINTAGKELGKIVWDSTNARLMVAGGTLDVDRWYIADGSGSVLPA